MGIKKRARKTGEHFDRIIRRIDEVPDEDLDTYAEAIRSNHKLSLEERRTTQQIKESERRIATDEELLALVQDEVIRNNFVRIADERVRVLGILSHSLGPDLAAVLTDHLFPEFRNKGYVQAVIDAWAKRYQTDQTDTPHGITGSSERHDMGQVEESSTDDHGARTDESAALTSPGESAVPR